MKWGHIKYISIVGLFPTVITEQRRLSLEDERYIFDKTKLNRLPTPYAVALMRRDTEVLRSVKFRFIENKPLVQQLGLALYFAAGRSPVAQLR